MVKRYHGPFRRIYSIFTIKIPATKPDLAILMSSKAINDSVGLDSIVLTLLVFDTYFKINKENALSP